MSGQSIQESLQSAMVDYDDGSSGSVDSGDHDFDPIDPITQEESSPSQQSKSAPGRDSSGRFVKSAEHLNEEVSEDTTTVTQELGQEEHDPSEVNDQYEEKVIPPAPSGFGRHQELWQKLNDPDAPFSGEDKKAVLDFYKLREGEMLKGISQYKDIAEKSQYLHKSIEQYVPQLLKEGIDPASLVGNLAKAHFTLSYGSPQEKLDTFNTLMQHYGVQFNAQQGQMQEMDPYAKHMMDSLRGVQTKLEQFENERLQKESQAIQSEISALQNNRTDFPLFDEAREGMIRLLESGHVKTFEDAYRMAIRLDDNLWNKHSARQLPPAQPKQQHIQQAKKAAVSVSNHAPVAKPPSDRYRAPVAPSKTNRQSIEDSLRAALGA